MIPETSNSPAMQLQADVIAPLPSFEADVSRAFVNAARHHGAVAWDIETSGLDWKSERIGLCQVLVKEEGLSLIKIKKNKRPANLTALLEDSAVQKIFHHAMFDLRFLSYHWSVKAQNIACTKIASKLLDPEKTQGHTLALLVEKYLGVTLDKGSRKSDWLTWGLSPDQLRYAGNDVKYLPDLLQALLRELERRNRLELARLCFAHIPTQVQLEIQGFRDIYAY
ncbi:MAG TPA: ribonuclease D [Candidatus Sulfotelmatobacter sp.]|nr:ribonuclease D [Candidatus Sulfotelmatobacter sp.]